MITLWVVISLVVAQQEATRQPPDMRAQQLFDRAIADFMKGNVRVSVDEFDRIAEMMPDAVPQLWQRGIAQYYDGRYKECARQFAAHQKVNPSDVENVAWHFVCVARGESLSKARASVLSIVPHTRVPMPQLYDLLRGLTTPQRYLEDALAVGTPEAEFDGHYYLGLYFEALGDTERTRIHISAAAADRFAPLAGFMHAAARVHLRQLDGRR